MEQHTEAAGVPLKLSDLSETTILARIAQCGRGKPQSEVREAMRAVGDLESITTELEIQSIADKIGHGQVKVLMNLMKQVRGIDSKAFTLQQQRNMLEWQPDEVLDALKNARENEIRKNPVYYFALFRTALNNERKTSDAITLAMAEVADSFGKENYLALMDCIDPDFTVVRKVSETAKKEKIESLTQEQILERLKKATPQEVKKQPDLYYALFMQATQNKIKEALLHIYGV